jgi:hypothetical protein
MSDRTTLLTVVGDESPAVLSGGVEPQVLQSLITRQTSLTCVDTGMLMQICEAEERVSCGRHV